MRDKHRPISEQVILDQERCIVCTRCVRFSSEVDGRTELVVNQRGHYNNIDVFENRPMESKFSGNVVDLCPVGALTAKDFRFQARPWELQKHEAICTGCSVGCNVEMTPNTVTRELPVRDKSIPSPIVQRLMPRENLSINTWWMCDKGRWGYHFHNDDNRVSQPMGKRAQSDTQIPMSLKEIQLILDSTKGDWEFWIDDSLPHEGIAWAKELASSWNARGRKVNFLNPSGLPRNS